METAFLRAVAADPYSDAPRLAFADWLAERGAPGDRDRAEFIALQCRLAAPGRDVPRAAVAARARELLDANRTDWEAPLGGLASGWEYRRGFPERVTLGPEQLALGLAELQDVAPVVRVRLIGLTPATAPDVAATPALARVRELDLSGTGVTADALRPLLRSGYLAGLRSLNVGRNPLGRAGFVVVMSGRVLRRLHFLDLSDVGLDAASAAILPRLLSGERGLSLRSIRLRGAPRLRDAWPAESLAGLPVHLRLSLESQLTGRTAPAASAFERLARRPADLPAPWRAWVSGQAKRPASLFPADLPHAMMSPALRGAFAAACGRRLLWHASRARRPAPDVPPADDAAGLGRLVRRLVRESSDVEREGAKLRDALAELLERELAGALPPDGRTR